MTVARADRDVSAASVISRRLATARGHRGAHESRGMIEQTTLTTLAGGQARTEFQMMQTIAFYRTMEIRGEAEGQTGGNMDETESLCVNPN
ncbi:hypothetical protein PAMP_019703 [Pampus punctatissimus]